MNAGSPSSRPATPSVPGVQGQRPVGVNSDPDVIADPQRKKYHRSDCRYANSECCERMPRSTARKRSYESCGICKP